VRCYGCRRLANSSFLINHITSAPKSTAGVWNVRPVLETITAIVKHNPTTIPSSLHEYFTALASLCCSRNAGRVQPELSIEYIAECLGAVLPDGHELAYQFLAFDFLAAKDLDLFEANTAAFARVINLDELARAVAQGYSSAQILQSTKDGLLWLLAHFIDLSRSSPPPSQELLHLKTLSMQLTALSSEITIRLRSGVVLGAPGASADDHLSSSSEPYVIKQLSSLVESQSISKLVGDFTRHLRRPSQEEFNDTSLLAGYSLALLQAFPANADDTRMRLFLEHIHTDAGVVPLTIFLWRIMQRTTIFSKLRTESERPVNVLRRYLGVSGQPSGSATEEQEWRIILLFLDLYTFILRLSDDEDFFSGMNPELLSSGNSTSRLRTCSLPRVDLELLTLYLKNTAFALHYNVQEIFRGQLVTEGPAQSRLESYLGSAESNQHKDATITSITKGTSSKLDIGSLRNIITTALKMLYERNSRKQFLPPDAWLMTSNVDQEAFIAAVIAEEQRQLQEEEEADGDEADNSDEDEGAGANFYSTMAGQRLSRHARLERFKQQQIRAQRERRRAESGPKLEILKHMPFVVPFDTRVRIFRQFVELDRTRRGALDQHPFGQPWGRHHGRIRRGNLFEDAYKQFYEIGNGLKDAIQITFVDQFDTPEAGIDGGGVTKEFLTSTTAEAFGAEDGQGMFVSNEQGLLMPNPIAVDVLRERMRSQGLTESDEEWRLSMQELLKRYEFLGRIVGKCLYEGILIDLVFAGFFLLKWSSSSTKEENRSKATINDLRYMDEELYKGMLRLKNYSGDISELGFDFTIEDQVSPPGEPIKTITRNLVANGESVPVTNDNRLLYISYVARHRLMVQPSLQTNAFLRGLRAIIRPTWLSMFNQTELQRLVGGDSTPIDIEDLRANTVYSGLYEIGDDGQEHPTIQLFWKVLMGFTDTERRDLLKYVSSTPRAPLLGFSQLRPKFSIRDGGTDQTRLPSTSTCVNLLKLPQYRDESTLREKLLYAITSGAGFDLS
jgi:ubiquitin-protein ligase E3 C